MKILNGKQVIFPLEDPFFFVDALAGGAMPVPTGVIMLFGFPAMGAHLPMASHVFGPAFLNAIHHPQLIAVQAMLLLICGQELFQHISYAQASHLSIGLFLKLTWPLSDCK